jgi:hypothetical protein
MLQIHSMFENNIHKNIKLLFSLFIGFYLIFNMADLFTIIKFHIDMNIDNNLFIAYGIYFVTQLIIIFHFLTKNKSDIQTTNEKMFDIILLINKIFIDLFIWLLFNIHINTNNLFATIMNYCFILQWFIMTFYLLCIVIGALFCYNHRKINNIDNDYKEKFLI